MESLKISFLHFPNKAMHYHGNELRRSWHLECPRTTKKLIDDICAKESPFDALKLKRIINRLIKDDRIETIRFISKESDVK